MAEPILDPAYWKRRLETATELHQAVFRCPLDRWKRIEDKHRSILAATLSPTDSVLDVGCGYGRLLTLMPSWWCGDYLGVDLSPDFVEMAGLLHRRRFFVADIQRSVPWPFVPEGRFDWAVLISFRPMVKRNLGDEVWARMETQVRLAAKRLLFLEYDPDDEGSVE